MRHYIPRHTYTRRKPPPRYTQPQVVLPDPRRHPRQPHNRPRPRPRDLTSKLRRPSRARHPATHVYALPSRLLTALPTHDHIPPPKSPELTPGNRNRTPTTIPAPSQKHCQQNHHSLTHNGTDNLHTPLRAWLTHITQTPPAGQPPKRRQTDSPPHTQHR